MGRPFGLTPRPSRFVATTRRNAVSLPARMGRRVAYSSHFLDVDNRAHRGKAKIKAKLIADHDSDEWELPPKPKWMRWRTYNRYEERFDRGEAILNDGIAELMAALLAIEDKT